MNKSLLGICFFLVAVPALRAAEPSIDEKIKSIRVKYAQIEKGLKSSRAVKRDLPGESAEGGELTAWFKDRSVEKLSAKFLGETGKALEEYYFWDSELIFVFRVEWRYTKPMSGVTKSRTKDRYYFDSGKLIQWLNADKKRLPLNDESGKRGSELQESAAKYLALARH